MKDIYEAISENELTEDLQLISSICGIEAVRQLLRHYSGMSFYVPKISRLDTFIIRYMKQHKDKTIKQLAQELKVSEQFLKSFRKKIN